MNTLKRLTHWIRHPGGRATALIGLLLTAAVLVGGLVIIPRGPATGPRKGQIISHPDNPYWLVRHCPDGNHTPVFLCGPGDPEGLLYKDTGASPETILEKLIEEGGNAIYVLAVRSHGGDGTPDQNPFIGQDPELGIDEDVLKKWHKILKPFDKAGIAIHFFLYDDGAKPFGMGMGVVSAGEERFIEAIVNRFEAYKNIIWNIAEEYAEGMTADHAREMARLIAKYDDHDHVIGISQNPGLDFHFEDDPHIGLWHIQSDCESADHANAIMGEVALRANQRYSLVYSEIYKYGYRLMRANDREGLRQLAWAVAMAGVSVMHGGMWHPSWQPTPVTGILSDKQRLHAFMQSIPDLDEQVGRNDLTHGSTEYVLTSAGKSWIAYSSAGAQPIGLKDLPAGDYEARWFDCVTGNEILLDEEYRTGGDQIWLKPGAFGDEVVLYLQRNVSAWPPAFHHEW